MEYEGGDGMMVYELILHLQASATYMGTSFCVPAIHFQLSTYGLEKQWRVADGLRPWAPVSALGDQEEGPGSQLLSVQL